MDDVDIDKVKKILHKLFHCIYVSKVHRVNKVSKAKYISLLIKKLLKT